MMARNSDVCLLYSESDKRIANLLEDALKYYSIDVWQMQNISIGNRIISETTKTLEKAKFIIVLWSNHSIKSALLKDLAYQEKTAKKVLIPVLIENVKIPSEFIDIQPADLIGWNGDRENDQIVKLWRILQEKVLRLQNKRLRFNQLIGTLGVAGTFIGAIFTITTPEIRCLLKIQCDSNNVGRKDILTPTEVPLETSSPLLPSKTISPSPSPTEIALPSPQSILVTPSPTSLPSKFPTNLPSKSDSAFVNTFEGLTIKLLNCHQETQAITCNLKVTSTNTDSPLRIYSQASSDSSRIIDISGNEYIAAQAKLGSKISSYSVESNLIKNTPVNAEIIFQNIPSKINQIAVLEVSCNNQTTNNSFKARFSNITLSE